jgi:hypothetical protein
MVVATNKTVSPNSYLAVRFDFVNQWNTYLADASSPVSRPPPPSFCRTQSYQLSVYFGNSELLLGLHPQIAICCYIDFSVAFLHSEMSEEQSSE